MNKQSKFFAVCGIIKTRNNIAKLAPHIKETIKQTIEAVESIAIDQKVNKPKSFGFKQELWIASAFICGLVIGLIF